ncbi:MAG: isochorismate synthase [Muribaculaceae bacterium]|nr:isochorismate synthase [Muribaculaceae bacterium]
MNPSNPTEFNTAPAGGHGFFIYRLPGSNVPDGYAGRVNSFTGPEKGFVIYPFTTADFPSVVVSPDSPITPGMGDAIVAEMRASDSWTTPKCLLSCNSTSKEEHKRMVERTVEAIREHKLLKSIISRTIVSDVRLNLSKTFNSLCSHYPGAFVFWYYTPATGMWMGASPELLLEKEGTALRTMALAGSRPTGSDGPWDEKNMNEHRIVTDFICTRFREAGTEPIVEETRNCAAGPVTHLMTPIHATARDNEALDLATRLSPTPALGGMPQKGAVSWISSTERHPRGYYGGFIGPADSNGDYRFFVNLRSMLIMPDKVCQFSGGGIMEESVADDEWEETERKADTLRRLFISTEK